ncbi:efflux RND transporter permease subunit [Candidatus Poribacteria bacterium]|nr:efflux RND transporter permease subunit [Candidatus Poribacteria bacterium]MYK22737.1 efflux RND transporter permease subunit [Candidatus Poribacteria bacterium]
MSIPKMSVNNPVLANLLMIIIILFGGYAWINLPRELTPEIALQTATVTTLYPGASPEEVEKLVTAPIEDAIEENVNKINLLLSNSSEGRSIITVDFEEMSDREFDKELENLRTAVEQVNELPEEILEDPQVIELDISSGFPMLTVVVGGDISESQMRNIAENLKDEILDIKNIAAVRIAGLREREIWVEVNPDRLKAYQLPIAAIITALGASNLNLPAGTMELGNTEFMVRTMGEFSNPDTIGETIIAVQPTGTPLRLSDVATVSDTYEEARTLSRTNGKSSISLSVQKKSEGNTIALVAQLRELVEKRKSDLPEDAELTAVNDYSVILKERLGILETNAIFGLVLVVLMLLLFIGWRNAVFAALGIPVAFMATFWFMSIAGYSLSSVSLFGLILVVGIVVDDAIVVIENIYRHTEAGESPKVAAIRGAQEVGWPVLAASLTTICAFGPLMFMSGTAGQFMRVVPIMAILVLIASLFEVFVILPAHVAEWGRTKIQTGRSRLESVRTRSREAFTIGVRITGFFAWFATFFDFIRNRYVRILKTTIRHRYAFVGSVLWIGLFACVGAFFILDKELFPGEDFPQFFVQAEMPPSYGIQETSEIVTQIETAAKTLPSTEVAAIVSNIGIHTYNAGIVQGVTYGSNFGEVIVELTPKQERTRGVDEIIAGLRKETAIISGIEELNFVTQEGGPPQGRDVEVKVKGPRFNQLTALADVLKERLHQMDGVYDIQDDFRIGKSELRIYLKPEKAHQYGLTTFQIAQTVRTAIEGAKATTYREADEAIDVVVKYEEDTLQNLAELNNLLIATPTGAIVPLKDVADITEEKGYSDIRRFDGERAITVYASVDREKTTPFEVNQALMTAFADIESLYPGYQLDFRGVFDEIIESFSELWKLFIVGLLLIYVVLGAQFKSFIQPIIIMFAVPFGMIGAMVGLLLSNATLSMVAMFGIVALSGIVVNDSIVLIDFINKYRENGYNKWYAILKGGSVRLRPIILTSLTTIIGLIPMAIGLGGKSPIWMPMAYTIIFGLALATTMTLFVMPALYAITTDLRSLVLRNPEARFQTVSDEDLLGAAVPADD